MAAAITEFLRSGIEELVRKASKEIRIIHLDKTKLYSRPEHWFDQWKEGKPDICISLFSEHFVRSFECECQFTFADGSSVEMIGLIMPTHCHGLSFREVLGASTANELQQEGTEELARCPTSDFDSIATTRNDAEMTSRLQSEREGELEQQLENQARMLEEQHKLASGREKQIEELTRMLTQKGLPLPKQ